MTTMNLCSTASGPLIVEDDGAPPYTYDEEIIVQLSDYFNKSDAVIEEGLVANPFVWSGETNAVLINGVGVSVGEEAGEVGCVLPVLDVEAGKTYRMRFIGATALSMTQLGFEDHNNLTIINVDGHYTKPRIEAFMQVSTGQRFDVLFQAKTEAELNGKTDYLIQFETKDRPSVYHGYGVLRYAGGQPSITKGPEIGPLTLPNETYAYMEYALEPLEPNNFPSASDVTRRITIYDRQVLTHTSIWRLSGNQWNDSTIYETPGDRPYLIDIYQRGPAAIPDFQAALDNKGWDPVTYTWPAKIGEVLEIIWVNTGSLVENNGGVDYHPFHAHGGHYYDIGSKSAAIHTVSPHTNLSSGGNGTYDPVANEKKLEGYNPVLRDTTNLYRYGSVTTAGADAGWRGWRVRVEDAGVWMIHCHILQHMAMGMQSVWVMGDYEQIARIPHYDAAGYLEYGGSAYGNETFAPSYVHQFDD